MKWPFVRYFVGSMPAFEFCTSHVGFLRENLNLIQIRFTAKNNGIRAKKILMDMAGLGLCQY